MAERNYKTDEETRRRCLANYHKTKGPTRAERKAQVWRALATSDTATEERGQTQHHLPI